MCDNNELGRRLGTVLAKRLPLSTHGYRTTVIRAATFVLRDLIDHPEDRYLPRRKGPDGRSLYQVLVNREPAVLALNLTGRMWETGVWAADTTLAELEAARGSDPNP